MSGSTDVTSLPTVSGTLALPMVLPIVAVDNNGVPQEAFGISVSALVSLVGTGAVGPTPTIKSGTIATLPPGSEATFSLTGTTLDPILNLGIPAGQPGSVGPQGATGATGATGQPGPTGAPGPGPTFVSVTATSLSSTSAPTVNVSGTSPDFALSFGIPAGQPGSVGPQGNPASITDAPTSTIISSSNYIGMSNGTIDEKITVTEFFDNVGTSLVSLSSAAAPGPTDTYPVLQNGTLVLQNEAANAAFVLGRFPLYFDGTVEITSNTALDGSVHNRKILICSQPITISEGATFVGNGFVSKIVNLSGGVVTLGSGFISSSGVLAIPNYGQADVSAVTYSVGNVYYANLGSGGIPAVGISVGVSNSNVPVGQSIGVIGTVNPSGTAVQIGYSTSNTVAPTSWTSATVSGYNFTGSIAGLSAGTYYVWARETATPSTEAISGAVNVAVYSIGITSVPSTGNTATPISASGTVGPSGSSVQIALSTNNSVPPSSGWVSATTTSGTWSGAITPTSTGTYYLWAQQIAQPTISAVSSAITISAPSNTVAITSPPTTATESVSVSLNGTVYPSGVAVEVAWSTSSTVAPTSGFVAMTTSGGTWSGSVAAPSSTGTYYIWAVQTANPSTTAVSPAVTITAPSNATITTTYGSLTFTNEAPFSSVQPPGTTIGVTLGFSPVQGTNATCNLYFTSTVPTSEPSSGAQSGSAFAQGTAGWYASTPSTPGTWYMSCWIDNTSSGSTGGCVFSPITVT